MKFVIPILLLYTIHGCVSTKDVEFVWEKYASTPEVWKTSFKKLDKSLTNLELLILKWEIVLS